MVYSFRLFEENNGIMENAIKLPKGASIYDVRKNGPPCHIQKSSDSVPFVCFLGTPCPPPHCGRHIWKPPNVETLDATFPFAGLSPSDTNLTCKSSPPRLWQLQSLQHKGIYLPCLQPDKHSLRSNVESKWAGRLIHARRKSNWQTCIMCFAERTNQVNNITRDQRKITFSCAFPSS